MSFNEKLIMEKELNIAAILKEKTARTYTLLRLSNEIIVKGKAYG